MDEEKLQEIDKVPLGDLREEFREQMEELKEDFAYVLDHVSVFQNRFGKDHLKLDLNPEALEKYRTKLKKP